MKRPLLSLALLSLPCAVFATDVGVSVTVGQPGFYGHIDIGNVPQQPQVIYRQPTVGRGEPVYMRVPPGHAKHWEKHCAEYNACGQRVYFVNEEWYQNVYAPHQQSQQEGRGGEGQRDQHGDEGRGHGKGHGRGHGNGRGEDRGD